MTGNDGIMMQIAISMFSRPWQTHVYTNQEPCNQIKSCFDTILEGGGGGGKFAPPQLVFFNTAQKLLGLESLNFVTFSIKV